MASQSLYRKWRSQTFSDLVGQEPVVRTLKNALDSGNLSHAYLFTGPRGTGKTSTARLLAKTLNCTNRQNGEPCNVCEQCVEITAGNSFNVIEIDAASNRGIDSIRELREKVMVRPSQGKYKIYILDEAHMLTTEAFNALLKTLEEPPEHAIFVMATTDVHKMLPTVLSRCQRFDFKRITTRQIVDHLNFVAGEEQVTLEKGAAELIARAAAGGMRDALSLLDQAIAYSGDEISLPKVQTMLGVADPRAIQKFVTHIAQLESAAGLHLIHELAEAGADLRQINTQVAEYIRAMMLHKAGANIADILDNTEDEIREITQTSQLFNLEELTDFARIFAQNDLMQKNQGTPQLGLELALLTCIEHHRTSQVPQNIVQNVAASIAPVRTQQQPAPHHQEQPRPAPAQQSQPGVYKQEEEKVQPEPVVAQPPTSVSSTSNAGDDALPDWDDVSFTDYDEEEESVASVAPPSVSVPSQQEQNVAPSQPVVEQQDTHETTHAQPSLTVAEIKDKWENIKRRVKSRKDGGMIQAVLNGYTIENVEGSQDLPIVLLRASGKFHFDTLQKEERRKSVEWAMKVELGQECQIRLLPPGTPTSPQGMSVPLPPISTSNLNGRAANSGVATPPQPSAYREPPITKPVPTPPQQPVQEPVKRHEPTNAAPPTVPLAQNPTVPLARTHIVRENTSSEPVASAHSQVSDEELPETHRELLTKKAKNDLVVQEVIRMFKADIKDVQPKQ